MQKVMLTVNVSVDKIINNIINLDFPTATFKNFQKTLNRLQISYTPKIITVAGTNGKGSTVAILSHIMQCNYVDHISHISPHIQYFNERISHNQKNIKNENLLKYLKKIYSLCIQQKIKLNHYFISFLCTWLYIQDKKPHWAILETGIGGRLDPVNLFNADIAIITTIALDHCEILGDSIEKIALEKAHIARPGKPTIFGSNIPNNAISYLTTIGANIFKANISPYRENWKKSIKIHPNSINCALTAISKIEQKLFIPCNLSEINLPGRFQIIQKENPLIIADIAHNPQSIDHFFMKIRKLLRHKPRTRVIALFTAKKNKDICQIINFGNNLVNLWLIPDLRAIDSNIIFPKYKHEYPFPKNSLFFDYPTAVFKYIEYNIDKNDLVVAFGSFALIRVVTEYYTKNA